jgi:hypothetical protein
VMAALAAAGCRVTEPVAGPDVRCGAVPVCTHHSVLNNFEFDGFESPVF